MKNVIVLLFYLLSPIGLLAQDFTMNQGFIENTDYYETIQFERVRDLVIINTTVNGKAKKFLLDTGAPTVVSESLKKHGKFKTVGTINVTDVNNRKGVEEVVSVSELAIGKVVAKDIPALVVPDDNPILRYLNVDGIIGSNLLRNCIVKISTTSQTIVFTDDVNRLELNASYMSNMFTDMDLQSSPVIKVRLGKNVEEQLLLDLGFDGFYNMSSNKLAMFEGQEDINVLSDVDGYGIYGIYGAEQGTDKKKVLIQEYNIGGYVFNNVLTVTSDNRNSKLGARILRCGDVTLDYINNKFYLQPYVYAAMIPTADCSLQEVYCGL